MNLSKVCTKCKEEKDISRFSKQSSTKDGFRYTCKECEKKANKKNYSANPEKYKEASLHWQAKNYSKTLEHKRAYYERRKNKPRSPSC